MHIPGTISKAYSDTLFSIINKDKELPYGIKDDAKWGVNFILTTLEVTSEIDEIEREIRIVLERIGSVNMIFFKSYSSEELVIGVKHYLIAWSTMKDLMASLINKALDLGVHENDLAFGMILRNSKVEKTEIPVICKKHAKKINVPYTDKQRNDAIHRGKLLDNEINEYLSKYNGLISQRYSIFNTNQITEDEFNQQNKALKSELSKLVEIKKTEYKKHFEQTLELNKELAVELAKLSAKYLNSFRL